MAQDRKKIKKYFHQPIKSKTFYGSPSKKANDDENDLYSRAKSLNLKKPVTAAVVIGVGGIGSTLALMLALYGYTRIILVDHDKVENSNRARTFFRKKDVGKYKAIAVKDMILERRSNISVKVYLKKIQSYALDNIIKNTDVFDCTDNLDTCTLFSKETSHSSYMKLGYDGLDVSLLHGKMPKLWGSKMDVNAYRVVPSFIVPPLLISSIALMTFLEPTVKDKFVNINIKNILSTFNDLQLIYSKLNINSTKELLNIIDNYVPRNTSKNKKSTK